MIVVTGANGALNGSTVDHLLTLVPAAEVAVSVRDVTTAQRFADLGLDVRRGDYADPTSLRSAFEGADQVLLVSSSDPGADAVALHRNAVDAATAAGVGRVVYTSHQGAALDSPFTPARDHAVTEQLLEESGTPWTALRNGFYAHSINFILGDWRQTGRMVVPADGPVSWTAREDSAEAAAAVLASNGAYDGPTTLTGPEAPTLQDVATIASEATGQDVELVVMDPEEWVSAEMANGKPERAVRFTLGIFLAAQQGYFAGVDPLLGELLGRRVRTVADLLASS